MPPASPLSLFEFALAGKVKVQRNEDQVYSEKLAEMFRNATITSYSLDNFIAIAGGYFPMLEKLVRELSVTEKLPGEMARSRSRSNFLTARINPSEALGVVRDAILTWSAIPGRPVKSQWN